MNGKVTITYRWSRTDNQPTHPGHAKILKQLAIDRATAAARRGMREGELFEMDPVADLREEED